MRFAKSIGACSVTVMGGFNDQYRGQRDPNQPSDIVSDQESYVARQIGYSIHEGAGKGWQGGGWEMMVGIECNSRNPHQANHHRYREHDGHVYGKILNDELCGVLGHWTMTKWSTGRGDTGSQMRTLQWSMLPTSTAVKALDNLYKTRDNASPRLEWLIEQIKSGYDQGAAW